jgi:hypothetical protein
MRMDREVVLSVLLALCAAAEAQETAHGASSTVPDTSRFEVIQSPVLAKPTIRLDRFIGDTWQFVSTESGGFAWQKVPRIASAVDNSSENYRVDEYKHRSFMVPR